MACDTSFVFNTALKPKNVDKIKDFAPGQDMIIVNSDIFTKLAPGRLDPDSFAMKKARDADDHIIYNAKKHTLSYDKNGSKSGGDKVFAKLKGDVHDIDASDFFVV